MSDETDTTVVETETDTGDASASSTETVLTDTGDDGAVAEVAAAQAILDADDPELSADDKAAAQLIVDAAADDAGSEGSDLPPDTYADFVMPEGVELDETALAEADPLFKEMGLSQEQAQKVIDLYAKQVQAGSLKQVETFNQLRNDWLDQSKNDKEFGGDKFDENAKRAQFAIATYGSPELKEALETSGLGNHPAMIRAWFRVSQTLGEDVPGSSGAVTTKAEDRVSILYPKENES